MVNDCCGRSRLLSEFACFPSPSVPAVFGHSSEQPFEFDSLNDEVRLTILEDKVCLF